MTTSLTEKSIERLRSEIEKGDWAEHEGFITEKTLCSHLGVSRVTVRRCLERLQEEELLRSIPYKGYVLGPRTLKPSEGTKPGGPKVDQVIYLQPPQFSPEHPSSPRDLLWNAAREEAESRNLYLQNCRMNIHSLKEELQTTYKNRLYGIALEWFSHEVADILLTSGIPAVSVEYFHEGLSLDAVFQDDIGGMEQAVDYLFKNGHRRIGFSVWSGDSFQPRRRRSAFAASMLRRNTVEGGRVGMSQRFDNEGGRETVRELFRHKKPPTVIIVSHIEMAAGVFDELEEMGLKIGKDISVIVWGRPDTKKTFLGQTKWKELDLDLISWSREEMGRVIIRILAARRVDPFIPPMRVEIPTNIIRGASVVNLNEQQ